MLLLMTDWFEKAKAELRLRKITYQDVADYCGVEKATVGHWMTGRNNPRIEQIIKIARMLGMSVSELTGEDSYYLHDSLEREFIDHIRNMSNDDRSRLMAIAESLDREKTSE